jgi:hypothetical protein
MNVESGRMKRLSIHLKPVIPRIVAMDVGIPPPRQSGEKERMRAEANPKRAAPPMRMGSHTGFALAVA